MRALFVDLAPHLVLALGRERVAPLGEIGLEGVHHLDRLAERHPDPADVVEDLEVSHKSYASWNSAAASPKRCALVAASPLSKCACAAARASSTLVDGLSPAAAGGEKPNRSPIARKTTMETLVGLNRDLDRV